MKKFIVSLHKCGRITQSGLSIPYDSKIIISSSLEVAKARGELIYKPKHDQWVGVERICSITK